MKYLKFLLLVISSVAILSCSSDDDGTYFPLPQPTPTAIVFEDVYPGESHVLAKDINGKVYSWGSDVDGSLGLGNYSEGSVPALVIMPAGVRSFTDISLGLYYTVAKGNNGKWYAWGRNDNGQLGIGNTENKNTPTLIKMPAGVGRNFTFEDIDTDEFSTVAEGNDGNLYAWGENTNGQLGVGDTIDKNLPTLVVKPSGVGTSFAFTDVHMGYTFAFAEGNNGMLYAWGNNKYGQLGVGDTEHKLVPTLVVMPAGVIFDDVSVGFTHIVAEGKNGMLYAWGHNNSGQLGVGDTVDKLVPTLVQMPAGVIFDDVSAGSFFSIAKSITGNVYAWGENVNGELGVGDTVNKLVPTLVTMPAGAVAIDDIYAGDRHVIVEDDNGKLYTWGKNTSGQLGVGDTVDRLVPTPVTMPAGVAFYTDVICSKYNFTFAKGNNGKLYAWGRNYEFTLGVGASGNRNSPTLVSGQ